MTRTCALLLVATLLFPNCAARGPSLAAQRISNPVPARTATASTELWRQFISKVPIGSRLRLQTIRGDRFTAFLMVVDEAAIVVSPRTRIPEPPRRLLFDDLAHVELATDSNGVAKAAGIGAAVGGATFLGLLLMMMAAWDD